jgi:chloramphenicol-sensitive protein RarD
MDTSMSLPNNDKVRETYRGVAYGLAAYLIWGFFPLYFKAIAHISPLEVLAHRSAWSLVTVAVILSATGEWDKVRAALTERWTLLVLCATTLLIAVNWLTFLFAVKNNQVLQSSFGYFINPLVSVLLGFLFLGERLRYLQLVSLGFAFAGVLVLAVNYGRAPWISLVLAVTFALPLSGSCST